WKNKTVLRKQELNATEIGSITKALLRHDLAFMLHRPIPENHYFWYHEPVKPPEDFVTRRERHTQFASPWDRKAVAACSQFLVVCDRESAFPTLEKLRPDLDEFSLIQATSPLDHTS